jgi:TPR repeat protein
MNLRLSVLKVAVVCLAFSSMAIGAEDRSLSTRPEDAEETYELRLERVLRAKGHRALIDHLRRELAERPRAYVKAWYANYLLYGADFGVKEIADPERGFRLAEESAAEGSVFGLELVGRAWGDGRGTSRRDPALAVEKLRAAVALNRNTAMAELGKFYFFGAGVTQNRTTAEELTLRGAWLGAVGAVNTLAEWWENAAYVGVPNRAKANELYFLGGQAGNASARNTLKERAKRGDLDAQKYVHLDEVIVALHFADASPARLKNAVKWLEANVAAEDTRAQLILAQAMLERQLPVYDVAAARRKIDRAIAAGSQEARFLDGMRLWRGIGEKTNEAAAVALWRELADLGQPDALNQMGWLHWWGNGERWGVPKDAEKAFQACRKAAFAGNMSGQLNLAECYAHGIGTPVNYFMAAKFYGILEDRRFKRAREMKERVLAYVKD